MIARRVAIAIPAALVVVGLTNPLDSAHAQNTVKTCTSFAEDGQRLRAAGKVIEARDKFMACSVVECPQVVRTDCAQWASDVLASTPTIVVDAKDANGNDVADAKVFVDDRRVADRIDGRPIAVDPGSRKIYVERSDGTSATQTIVAKENAKGRQLKMVLGPPGAPPPASAPTTPTEGATKSSGSWTTLHWAGIGMIVVGAIAASYSLATYLTYRSDESNIKDKFFTAEEAAKGCSTTSVSDSTCAKNIATREDLRRQYNENEEDAKSKRPLIIVGAFAGPLLVAGGVLLIVFAPKSNASPSVQGRPIITPTFGGMSIGGTF
jgi:hypothetical protein